MSDDGLGLPSGANLEAFCTLAVGRSFCTAAQIQHAREELQKIPNPPELTAFLKKSGILTSFQIWACEHALRGSKVIAGFEVLEKVGQGGMGAVYRARQISMERIVALKILPPQKAQDPVQKQRFLNEARLSAHLSHLNIISGIDCGEANGLTYFAMEFVDGLTLKQVLKQTGKLPPGEALSIVLQIGEALVYARKKGLVHRDIKPDNIMLTSKGVAKLCDLGIAQQVEKKTEGTPAVSEMALGTPHYIAPEQARGQQDLDSRADLYALGATFYHLVTGRTPFKGSSGAAVITMQITHQAPSPCELEPGLPAGYGQVISKMMAKSRDDRYLTPEELIADLNLLAAGRPPSAAAFTAPSSCAMPAGAQGAEDSPPSVPVSPEHNRPPAGADKPPVPPLLAKIKANAWVGVLVGTVALVAAIFVYDWYGVEPPATPSAPEARQGTTAALPPVAENTPKITPVEPVKPAPGKPAPTAPPDDSREGRSGTPKGRDTAAAVQENTPKTAPGEAVKTPAEKPAPAARAPLEDSTEGRRGTPAVHTPPPRPKPAPPPPHPAPANQAPPGLAAGEIEGEEPAAPEAIQLEITPEILYARFLGEMKTRAAKADVRKILPDLREKARSPEYQPAAADIRTELADLALAAAFEQEALQGLAAAGGEVELSEEAAKKFKAARATVLGLDLQRGIHLAVQGADVYFPAFELAPEALVRAAGNQSDLARVRYLAARGSLAEAAAQVEKLPPGEKARWQRKLDLLRRGEQELLAQAHFDLLNKLCAAKRWTDLNEWAAKFVQAYGASAFATANKTQLLQLISAARSGLEPGLEASGRWHPDATQGPSACTVRFGSDEKTGNKTLLIEAHGDNAPPENRISVTRLGKRNVTVGPRLQLVLRAKHNLPAAVTLYVLLFSDKEAAHPLPPIALNPGADWREYCVNLPPDLHPGEHLVRLSLGTTVQEHFVLELEHLVLQ